MGQVKIDTSHFAAPSDSAGMTKAAARAETSSTRGETSGFTDRVEGTSAIVVIEQRVLIRECLARCLKEASGCEVIALPSIDSWHEFADRISASLIVICTGDKPMDAETRKQASLFSKADQVPTIYLSDVEAPDHVAEVLEMGARGYIPTSVSLEVAIEAMRLVKAGGVFAPASSLLALRRSTGSAATQSQSLNGILTARQAAIVEALRRGKTNKIIAYELNMRESTVKVHVRNIMKKLNARNRTEIAFIANNGQKANTDECEGHKQRSPAARLSS